MSYRILLVTVLAVSTARADTIHVDGDNCPGPGDGSELGPYCSIQTAIDNAVDMDEIVVAPGTYFETINFLGKAIWLHSSGGSNVTTIDAGGFGGLGTVVTCESGEGPDTVLAGFTVTGGYAGVGGGMYNDGSSPTVIGCRFFDNVAIGGGMYNENSNPKVIDCIFDGNIAFSFGGGIGGGGMYNDGSSPTVTNCTFIGNVGQLGGGMLNENAGPTVTNCTFSGNTANSGGGGMQNMNSSPVLTDCTFIGNSAGFDGGGMRNVDSNPTLANCTFIENSATFVGGMDNHGGSPTVTNCTFSGNSGDEGGGMYIDGNATVTNCVLWGNSPDQISASGTPAVTYTDVQGGFPGIGNIDADPLFVDPANGDYHLQSGSSAIDAGHNWGVSPDFADLDADGDTAELTPFDLDGNPRFVADPADFDPGCGIPAVVDMGAYEFQIGGPFPVRLGDIDGDGVVGITDFLALLADWGSCTQTCCLADLDLDENVGILDLLILLGNWG